MPDNSILKSEDSRGHIQDMVLIEIINEFFYSLGGLGSLHWSFVSWEVFSKYLRMNLTRQMQYWKNKSIKISIHVPDFYKKHKLVQQQIDQLESTEEEGFLDLVEKGNENFEMLKEVVNRMEEEIGDLADYAANITERKMYMINISIRELALRKVKRICNQVAGRHDSFNKRIEFEMPSLRMYFSTAIDSYGKATTLLADNDTDIEQDVLDVMDIVNEIKKFAADTREDMGSFRETIANFSYAETKLDRANRKSVEVLDKLDQELKSGITLIDEVENLMRNLLG
jgi:hypothetical protein